MQYSNHPDYLQHCDNIINLLENGYEIKVSTSKNAYTEIPPILDEKYYSSKHHQLKNFLNTKQGALKVLGFKRNESLTRKKIFFVCECNCGNFTETSEKLITNPTPTSYLCCSDCKNEVFSFLEAYGKLTGLRLHIHVGLSIFNLYSGEKFDDFVYGPYDNNLSQENNPLFKMTYEEISRLLLPNSDSNEEYWEKSNNQVIYKRNNKKIEGVFVDQPETISANEFKKIHPSIHKNLGKKIFRYTIIGGHKTNKPLNPNKLPTLVGRCDCGLYGLLSLDNLKLDRLPSCSRCDQIICITISKYANQNCNEISREEAWKLLNQDTSAVPNQIALFKPSLSKTLNEIIKPVDHRFIKPEFKQIIGKRIGLVTPIAVSNNYDANTKSPYFICKCECGSDCKLNWDHLKPSDKFKFFACPACCSEIQGTFKSSINPERGVDGGSFFAAWNKFIQYQNAKKVDFTQVFRLYLKEKKSNKSLKFRSVASNLIKSI